MRPNTPEVVRRANARALIAALLCAALVVACLCLPLYSFSATVFAKKSGNTFVGDEKYKEVRAEVEAEARARADAAGTLPEIVENVTERTNSKGEKTSMVAFEVRQAMRRTGWDFVRSPLASGRILLALILCLLAAAVLLGAGMMGDGHGLAGAGPPQAGHAHGRGWPGACGAAAGARIHDELQPCLHPLDQAGLGRHAPPGH